METAHVLCRLDPMLIGQFKKTFGSYPDTESPLFRLTGFEVGELFLSDGVLQDVRWRSGQFPGCAGKRQTMDFDLFCVHEPGFTNCMKRCKANPTVEISADRTEPLDVWQRLYRISTRTHADMDLRPGRSSRGVEIIEEDRTSNCAAGRFSLTLAIKGDP